MVKRVLNSKNPKSTGVGYVDNALGIYRDLKMGLNSYSLRDMSIFEYEALIIVQKQHSELEKKNNEKIMSALKNKTRKKR